MVFYQGVSCQCPGTIGTNNEREFDARTRRRLYLNTAAPAPCSGTVSELRYCYYRPGDLQDDVTYHATVAVYRPMNLNDGSVRYNRISDVFAISLTGANISAKSDNFTCTTLDHPDFGVEARDVVGACIVDPPGNSTHQLNLVGNTRRSPLMHMKSSGCSLTDIPSPVSSVSLEMANSRILHVYANITGMCNIMSTVVNDSLHVLAHQKIHISPPLPPPPPPPMALTEPTTVTLTTNDSTNTKSTGKIYQRVITGVATVAIFSLINVAIVTAVVAFFFKKYRKKSDYKYSPYKGGQPYCDNGSTAARALGKLVN